MHHGLVSALLLAAGILTGAGVAHADAGFVTEQSGASIASDIDLEGVHRRHVDCARRVILERDYIHKVKGWFVSTSTAPAPGLRVRVENRTPGFDDTPYTDRSYDSGRTSDKIYFDLGDEHETPTFSVQAGTNHFAYRIYDGAGRTVEDGTFSADVGVEWHTRIEDRCNRH
jgi:hypothetical protein